MAKAKTKTRGFGTITPFRDGHRARIYLDGQRHERVFPREALAKRWLDLMSARKVEMLAGVRQPRGTAEDVTFADVADEYLADLAARRTYTDRTLEDYRSQTNRLVEFWGTRRVASVRDRDVDAWVRKLRESGLSTSRIRHLLDRLSQCLMYCKRQEYVGTISVTRIERPRLVQKTVVASLTDLELGRLVRAAWDDHDRRAPVLVLLGSAAGLRASEMVQLRGEDVQLERGYLRVEVRGERRDRTKTGEARTVPLTDPDLRSALESLPRKQGRPLLGVRSRDGLSTILGRAWRAAGLPGAPALHRLRHTYATKEALAGTPIPLLQRRLGHRTILTTMRYVHVTDPLGPAWTGYKPTAPMGNSPKRRGKPR